MKGSYHFLAVDECFVPWIFLIRSSEEDLLEKVPELIEKATTIGKRAGLSEKQLQNLVVVFDREGYSGKLYRYLDGQDEGDGKRRAFFVTWSKYSSGSTTCLRICSTKQSPCSMRSKKIGVSAITQQNG